MNTIWPIRRILFEKSAVISNEILSCFAIAIIYSHNRKRSPKSPKKNLYKNYYTGSHGGTLVRVKESWLFEWVLDDPIGPARSLLPMDA